MYLCTYLFEFAALQPFPGVRDTVVCGIETSLAEMLITKYAVWRFKPCSRHCPGGSWRYSCFLLLALLEKLQNLNFPAGYYD